MERGVSINGECGFICQWDCVMNADGTGLSHQTSISQHQSWLSHFNVAQSWLIPFHSRTNHDCKEATVYSMFSAAI